VSIYIYNKLECSRYVTVLLAEKTTIKIKSGENERYEDG